MTYYVIKVGEQYYAGSDGLTPSFERAFRFDTRDDADDWAFDGEEVIEVQKRARPNDPKTIRPIATDTPEGANCDRPNIIRGPG